jgi:4-hydroxybenzoate polyprenyltransferase
MNDSFKANASAPGATWVDRRAPATLRPWLKLARVDRPIGVWLLMWPCWWSAALAAEGAWPDPRLLVLFAIGAFVWWERWAVTRSGPPPRPGDRAFTG